MVKPFFQRIEVKKQPAPAKAVIKFKPETVYNCAPQGGPPRIVRPVFIKSENGGPATIKVQMPKYTVTPLPFCACPLHTALHWLGLYDHKTELKMEWVDMPPDSYTASFTPAEG